MKKWNHIWSILMVVSALAVAGVTVGIIAAQSPIDQKPMTRETLLASAKLGGDYLIRAVKSNGKFVYQYDTMTDEKPPKYNMLRHCGTIYSMLELYGVTRNPVLLSASEKAIGFLLKQIKEDGDFAVVLEKGYAKLGGNGLALIALAEYTKVTENKQYLPLMKKLANWIKYIQHRSGNFPIHKMYYATGRVEDFQCLYYTGEALLGLLRLYNLAPDETLLDVCESGAKYVIQVINKDYSDRELPHDHWLLYALNELYRYRKKALYLDYSLRLATVIMNSQHTKPQKSEWLGGFYNPPRSTPTATRIEGLCAVYKLAKDNGKTEILNRLQNAIHLGIGFQLSTQLKEQDVKNFKNPRRSLGGFRGSLDSYEVRIDYVQHNISSILAYYQILGELEYSQKK